MRLFTLVNKDCGNIIHTVSQHYDSLHVKMDIAMYQMGTDMQPAYLILSLSDEIDNIVTENGAEEKYDFAIERLREDKNYYPLIFGDETVVEFIPYIIPFSPANCLVKGNSGKEYLFQVFNINDKIRDSAAGVYIFTVTHIDSRGGIPINSHIFLSFSSIRANNEEAIAGAKDNGAKHFFYYYSGAEYERQEIIEDIKTSQDYQYQLENFAELITPQ